MVPHKRPCETLRNLLLFLSLPDTRLLKLLTLRTGIIFYLFTAVYRMFMLFGYIYIYIYVTWHLSRRVRKNLFFRSSQKEYWLIHQEKWESGKHKSKNDF
jgi:hypothetical protein